MKSKVSLILQPRSQDTSTVDLIKELDVECFPIDDRVNPAGGWWWLLTVEGNLAGYAGLKKRLREPWCYVLTRAGVLPEFRGHQFHRRLIRSRVNYVWRYLGGRKVVTYTTPENIYSANSLISCGFRLYEPKRRWAGKDFLYFKRELRHEKESRPSS